MRRVLLAFALLAVSACASGPSLQSAIGLHNQSMHVLDAVDVHWAPVYTAAMVRASAKFPDDDVAYRGALTEFDAVNEFINHARQFTQLLHLAVEQWQALNDGGDMLAEIAPCGVEALNRLGDAFVAIPTAGAGLYAMSKMLALQVERYSDGGECHQQPVAAEVRP